MFASISPLQSPQVNLVSTLLLCSRDEEALAVEAFQCAVDDKHWAADLGSRVSRKKDFVPPLSAVLQRGWQRPPPRVLKAASANGEEHQCHDCADEEETEEEVFGQVVHECGERGCITRRLPSMPGNPALRRSHSEGGPTAGGGRPPLVAHALKRQNSL